VTQKASQPARQARCAHCHRVIAWVGNPHRPFCSLACRLIDLGVWLDERYRIPGAAFRDDIIPNEAAWHDSG